MLLPGGNPLLWGAGAALAGALAFGTVQSVRLAEARGELADEEAAHALADAKLSQAAQEQTARMRATEQQWKDIQDENARLSFKARERALADVAAADVAADRLRDRFATVAAACRSTTGNPSAVAASPAASAPGDLLADVLGRLDSAARRIAAYADDAAIAGEQCAADYRALKTLAPESGRK